MKRGQTLASEMYFLFGVGQTAAGAQPSEHGQAAIAAGGFAGRDRQWRPDITGTPELQAIEAGRRHAGDDVGRVADPQLPAYQIGRPAERGPQAVADDRRRPRHAGTGGLRTPAGGAAKLPA